MGPGEVDDCSSTFISPTVPRCSDDWLRVIAGGLLVLLNGEHCVCVCVRARRPHVDDFPGPAVLQQRQ